MRLFIPSFFLFFSPFTTFPSPLRPSLTVTSHANKKTMDSASTRFFYSPEFAAVLGPHLDKNVTATLSRTCRYFKAVFEPWLYHNFKFSSVYSCDQIIPSPASVRVLSRNVQYFRRLTVGQKEITYLFNCFVTAETAGNSDTATAAVGHFEILSSSPRAPSLRFPLTPLLEEPYLNCAIIPLPPMSRLTHLELNLMLSPSNEQILRKEIITFAQTIPLQKSCWIIQHCSSRLTSLKCSHVPILNHDEMQLLVATIQGISCLQNLDLFICAKKDVRETGLHELFFRLPEGVKTCRLEGHVSVFGGYHWERIQQEEGELEEDKIGEDGHELDITVFPHCKESLVNLTRFDPWSMSASTHDEVLAVFDHCPNIKRLMVPNVAMPNSQDLTTLARSISNRCPHIRILSSPAFDANETFFFSFMEAITPQQLQKVYIRAPGHTVPHGVTRAAFLRHSASLRVVDVRYAVEMTSTNLRAILEICEGLEVFRALTGVHSRDKCMTLADAISVPWVASKTIRHLEITIELPATPQTPYYQRPAPVILSDEETLQFADLERFYRKIGSLTALEYLDLRAVFRWCSYSRSFTEKNSFPAMLNLPDINTGEPGYLNLLCGWTRLKTLRGSVKMDTYETMASVGEQEVEWFLQHWPALERVRFFSKVEDVRDGFLRFEKERPNVLLSC